MWGGVCEGCNRGNITALHPRMKAFLLFSLLSLVATDELMSVVLVSGGVVRTQ